MLSPGRAHSASATASPARQTQGAGSPSSPSLGGGPAQAAMEGEGAGGRASEQIHVQSAAVSRDSRDRRLDLRRRDVVEDELDRVRQGHRLLAAGAKRKIEGKKATSAHRAAGQPAPTVGGLLRERLDGSLQRMSDLFKGFDSSWDGLVSRDEFRQALQALELFTNDAELEALFAAIDVDRSGEIDFRELKRHLMHSGGGEGHGLDGKLVEQESGVREFLERRRSTPARQGTFSVATGRDMSTLLLNGIEPPDRRSLGPASYDPRRGSAYTRPSVVCGGDTGRAAARIRVLSSNDGSGMYIHKGLDADEITTRSPPPSPGDQRLQHSASQPTMGSPPATKAVVSPAVALAGDALGTAVPVPVGK